MKLNRLLACVFAGIIAVSCSTENGTETTPEEGLPTAVRVKVEKKGTRATGDLTAVEALESTVNDVTVLVFRGDGTKDGGIIKAVPDSEGMVEVLNTTAGTRDFIVVANAPDGIFDLSMNKSAAESAVMTLLSSQVPDKLVMAGTVTETLEPADDPSDNEIEVSISRMAARVALTGIEIDIDRLKKYSENVQ